MSDRPWTPGPWKELGLDIEGADDSWVTRWGEGGGMEWSDADHALCVLAPEMAEAILHWQRHVAPSSVDEHPLRSYEVPLLKAAEKILTIKGTNNDVDS